MSNYTYDYLQKNPKETKRLLGINYEQLQELIALGKLANQKYKEQQEKSNVLQGIKLMWEKGT